MINYLLVKSPTILSQRELKSLGEKGWKLGGIAQARESVMNYKASSNVRRDLFHYHFWREESAT